MADVVLRGVVKRYGPTVALRGIDVAMADRGLTVVVGPSGCGKSTLLKIIAGLEDVDAGEVLIGGRRVNHLPPAKRDIAMVFQSYALYPHMTVFENMAFPLRTARLERRAIERKVRQVAGLLGLDGLLERKPRALSGGQQQRVAMGRAMVRDPAVYLFDEPLSNLDAQLRVQMRAEIARLQAELAATTVYVTHDQVEAMTLAHRIVVLHDGAVEQAGAPLELYHRPANRFVAGFIGAPRMNFLAAEIAEASPAGVRARLPGGRLFLLPVSPGTAAAGETVTLGLRPEHVVIGGGLVAGQVEATVVRVESLGAQTILGLEAEPGPIVAVVAGDRRAAAGERLTLHLPAERCHLFDKHGMAFESLAEHCSETFMDASLTPALTPKLGGEGGTRQAGG
jgi:ABC-type sugar transport system ATPase subunit